MTPDELGEIVQNLRALGRDISDIEAKRADGGLPRSLRQTISAFANTRGGVIILGLDEAQGFATTGLRDPAKISSDLAAMCSMEIEPPIRPLIDVPEFEGKRLVVAEIPELEPSQKPCYYRGAGMTKGSYVRVADGDRQLSSYEVQLILASRGQPRDDEEPVPGTTAQDLDPTLVDELVARLRVTRPFAFGELDRTAVLRRARVLVPGDLMSLAGLLALGRYPQEHFPDLMLTFVHYPTEVGVQMASGERFIDNVVVEGPIPVMVRDAVAAVRRNMKRRGVVTGIGRTDVWEYPETALREAIVNALVHRDLSRGARGTHVQVEMYPDRLLIRNPGGLFGPVTLDNLGEEGVSSSRNAVLMRLLEDVPVPGETRAVCEHRGSGIRAMLEALRAAKMSAPRFDDRIATFVVIFPNHTLLSDERVAWIAGPGQRDLTDSQCVALAMLKDGEVLDNRTYRAANGLDSRIATAELQDLVSRGLVTQAGTGRWSRYQLSDPTDRHQPSGRIRLPSRADRRAEVLRALGMGTLTRADLAKRTGLTDRTVRRWLAVMRTEGLVEMVSQARTSPTARYRRAQRSPR